MVKFDFSDDKKIGVLFSGGLDSTVLVANSLVNGKEVHLLSFNDRSSFFQLKEKIAIELIARHFGLMANLHYIDIVATDELEIHDGKWNYIPGWKMIMQTSAMAYCEHLGIQSLYFGYNADNHVGYDDEKPEMVGLIADTYNKGYFGDRPESKIGIYMPYYNVTKSRLVEIGHALKVPFNWTLSCGEVEYPGLVHCGKCDLCEKRREAFRLVDPYMGITDTTLWWPA